MNTVWQKLLKIIQIMLENREILGWIPAFAGAGLLRRFTHRNDSDELDGKNYVEIINYKCIIIIVK